MKWSKATVAGLASVGAVMLACKGGDNAAERNGSGVGT